MSLAWTLHSKILSVYNVPFLHSQNEINSERRYCVRVNTALSIWVGQMQAQAELSREDENYVLRPPTAAAQVTA